MKKELAKEFEKLPFEAALEKLETIVSKMETGKLPLDEMIKHFEEGNALASVCGGKLKQLEKKIELLVRETADGGEWKNFEDSEGSEETPNEKTELF